MYQRFILTATVFGLTQTSVVAFTHPALHVAHSNEVMSRHQRGILLPSSSSRHPLHLRASAVPETEEEISPIAVPSRPEEEKWEMDSKVVELAALAIWMGTLSAFILVNNFVGPWPAFMSAVPERIWFTLHMLGGMLFGGGIILTTALEWLVADNKNESVLQFYFDKVPLLDAAIVLPGLTMAMISGTGLTIERYGGLGIAPPHIPIVFYTLTAFAGWWAVTDLSSQGSALTAINEWAASAHSKEERDVPHIVELRKISNVVSCLFVVALYAVMVMKPGTLHHL